MLLIVSTLKCHVKWLSLYNWWLYWVSRCKTLITNVKIFIYFLCLANCGIIFIDVHNLLLLNHLLSSERKCVCTKMKSGVCTKIIYFIIYKNILFQTIFLVASSLNYADSQCIWNCTVDSYQVEHWHCHCLIAVDGKQKPLEVCIFSLRVFCAWILWLLVYCLLHLLLWPNGFQNVVFGMVSLATRSFMLE